AVERTERALRLGGEEERLVAEHVVGAPLRLEVDLMLVGEQARRRQPALELLDLAADADLLPLLAEHLGDPRERQEADVRGEREAQPAAAVAAEAIAFRVLLREPELVEHRVRLL